MFCNTIVCFYLQQFMLGIYTEKNVNTSYKKLKQYLLRFFEWNHKKIEQLYHYYHKVTWTSVKKKYLSYFWTEKVINEKSVPPRV